MTAANVTPPVARAVVHACDTETTYLRAGSGAAMILVASDLDAEDVVKTVTTLSREFTVLAAAPSCRDSASLGRWLQEFLECLGVDAAHVVLHASASAILTGDSIDA